MVESAVYKYLLKQRFLVTDTYVGMLELADYISPIIAKTCL